MSPATNSVSHEAGMGNKNIPELNGLRGIAIILVLMHHMAPEHLLQPYPLAKLIFYPFSTLGWAGVDIFFVLSGFLITGILLESKRRKEAHYFRNFYARRVLRIMPIYYLLLFLVLVAWRGYFKQWIGTASIHSLYYLFYLQNWLEVDRVRTGFSSGYIGHLWSLGLEEQFYLIWPCVVWLLSPRWLVIVSVSLIVCGIVARLVINAVAATGFEAYSYSSFTRYDELAFGSLVAVGRFCNGSVLAQMSRRWCFQLTAAFVTVLVCTLGYFGIWSPQIENPGMRIIGYSLLGAISAGLILKALYGNAKGMFRRLLRTRLLGFVGVISYGLYVYHSIVQCIVADMLHGFPEWSGIVFSATVTLAITFVVAYASFRFLEAPLLGLKRHFSSLSDG